MVSALFEKLTYWQEITSFEAAEFLPGIAPHGVVARARGRVADSGGGRPATRGSRPVHHGLGLPHSGNALLRGGPGGHGVDGGMAGAGDASQPASTGLPRCGHP